MFYQRFNWLVFVANQIRLPKRHPGKKRKFSFGIICQVKRFLIVLRKIVDTNFQFHSRFYENTLFLMELAPGSLSGALGALIASSK